MPEFSVLMSNYNTPVEYLEKAINSVLIQTFTDFELVIVNDGSEDASRDMLYTFAEKDNRIRIIENGRNLGLAPSLNHGLRECRGKYIARFDTDDICYSERLSLQYEFMESNPDCILSGGWADVFEDDENTVIDKLQPVMCPYEEYKIRLLFSNSPIIVHPTAVFRREALIKNGLEYDTAPKYRYTEDYRMWVKCAKCGEVKIQEKTLIKYRNAQTEARITVRHKEQMKNCALAVQQEQLEALGIDVTPEMLEYNNLLLMGRKPYDIKYKQLIDLIIAKNEEKRIYDSEILKKLLHERWYNIVYYGIAYEKNPVKRAKYFGMLYPEDRKRFIGEIVKN